MVIEEDKMICYADKTFCASPDCKNECGVKLTEKVISDAKKWWGEGNGEPPICVAYFCGEK